MTIIMERSCTALGPTILGLIIVRERSSATRVSNPTPVVVYIKPLLSPPLPAGYKVIKGSLLVLDLIVLKFCLLSLYLTGKTLRRAYRLGKAMGKFYHHRLHLPLSWWERRSLFSKWHYVNIISDLIVTAGTVYKILLEFDVRLYILTLIPGF